MNKINGTVTLNFSILTDVDVSHKNMTLEESDKYLSGLINTLLTENFWIDDDIFVKTIEEVLK